MKYVATIEIEFETDDSPLEKLHLIMEKVVGRFVMSGHYAEHYHIVEQPKELK